MSLLNLNLFPEAATLINEKTLSDERKSELKGIYLESLIRFLDIYANDEIGGNVEIDMTKIALLINSASFENDDLFCYETIEDIFSLLENLAIAGLPIWRFLKLSDYQLNLFEKSYDKLREEKVLTISNQKSCYGCVFLENLDTDFGTLTRCQKPSCIDRFKMSRDSLEGIDLNKGCKWLTTLEHTPKCIQNKEYSEFTRERFLESVDYARKKFIKNLTKDDFRLPKNLSEQENISLTETYDSLSDLMLVFSNKRGKIERQDELRKAMLIEGMIRFFEIYAKTELGSNFVANIKEISIYVDSIKIEDTQLFKNIKSFEDIYEILENMILNDFDIKKFVKYNDLY